MADFRSVGRRARQRSFDYLDNTLDPTYGADVFRRMIRESAPSLDTFLSAQRATGGSGAMAREQAQGAQARAQAQGMRGFRQFRLNQRQQGGRMLQALMSDARRGEALDLQRQELQFRRDQQGGLSDILAGVGGRLAGSFLGPFGAEAGGMVADELFE
jgi:hypothetical protein